MMPRVSFAAAAATSLLLVSLVTARVVKNENELRDALKNSKPGDVIELQSKTYTGLFKATAKGTRGSPITLRGPKDAILDGGRGPGTGYVLHLDDADFWIVQGFTVRNAQKGIMLDYSDFCVLDNVTVTDTGMEGVHFRKYSSDNVIKNSVIKETGVTKPGFGEGIYVGSSKNNWDKLTDGQKDMCDRNKILNNKIGPNVRGENVDIKEGTQDGEISGNTFDGNGLSNSHSDKSWVNIKGNGYYISKNRGKNALKNGFEVNVLLADWGEGNVFDGNNLDTTGAEGYGIWIKSVGHNANIVYDNNKAKGASKGLTNIEVTKKP